MPSKNGHSYPVIDTTGGKQEINSVGIMKAFRWQTDAVDDVKENELFRVRKLENNKPDTLSAHKSWPHYSLKPLRYK